MLNFKSIFCKKKVKSVNEVTPSFIEINNRVYAIKHIVSFEKFDNMNTDLKRYELTINTVSDSKKFSFESVKERDNLYKKLKYYLEYT